MYLPSSSISFQTATKTPTPPPTNTPTSCGAAVDESCRGGTDCCSGLCSGGKPANRVCLVGNGPTPPPAPTPPTTPAPVAPPTTEETPAPVGSCGGNKSQCSDNFDCCSFNCKNGQCKGGR